MIKKYPNEFKESGEYGIWNTMKTRCVSKSARHTVYQKKGISVCDEWKKDFFKFIEDMGRRPSKSHTVERIDNKKGYCKENCRWETMYIQTRNKSCNLWFTYNGEAKILKDWAIELNIPYKRLHTRIKRDGLSFEDAIKDDPFKQFIEIDGVKKRIIGWCKFYNREYKAVIGRIHGGWDKVTAILTPTKNNVDYNLFLNKNQKIEIEQMLRDRKKSTEIATLFNVTPSCICIIKRNLNIEKIIRTCAIKNCERPHKAKGYCRLHYDRNKQIKLT